MKAQRLSLTLAMAAWLAITGSCPNLAQGGTLSGMFVSLAGVSRSIDLTQEGQLDWAYWGYAQATDLDQKEGGTNEIGNYMQIGTNSVLWYGNSESIFNWEDGTPDLTATNMTSGIYFYGVSNGYEVDVTADTTPRLFNIYVGAWGATIHFEATLSDGSAPTYVDETFSHDTSGGANRRYTIIYAANSPGQTLQVRVWVIAIVDPGGNDTLQAASLQRVPPLAVTQPVVSPTNIFAAGTPITMSVQAQGPFPYYYQWLVNSGSGFVAVPGSDTNTLLVNTTGLHGGYTYEVIVTNTSGSGVTSAPVTLTATTASGTLRVESLNLANVTEINLTAEGTLDWADWGLYLPTDFNDKAGGTGEIGDYSPVGATLLDYYQYNDNAQGFTWTDGTPTLDATNSTTGVYVVGLGDGFEVDVAAQQTNQLFNLYNGVYSPGGNVAALHLEAWLSDGSAPVFVDESVSGIQNQRYSMIFAAASPNQKLIVRYWVMAATDGNVTLQAATVEPVPPLSASAPVISPSNVVATGSSTLKLSTQAQGLFPYYYQWQVNNGSGYADIADSNTNAIYVTTPSVGTYSYQVVVSNSSQTIISAPSVLTVTPATSTLTVTSRDVHTNETIDLTAEGTLDWAAWGLSQLTDFDDKAGVTSQISNYIALGTADFSGQYGNNYEGFSWTDGNPTPDATNVTTGIYVGGLGAGYEVDVPATATPRILTLHVGGYFATAHFEASLSDGSAPYYVDESFTTVDPNGSDRDYTVTYAAPSAGPKPYLMARFWQIAGQGGNVTLSAASLQEAVNLSLQRVAEGNLQLTWPTGTLLETSNLAGPWVTNTNTSPYIFAPAGPQKFYRVKVQ